MASRYERSNQHLNAGETAASIMARYKGILGNLESVRKSNDSLDDMGARVFSTSHGELTVATRRYGSGRKEELVLHKDTGESGRIVVNRRNGKIVGGSIEFTTGATKPKKHSNNEIAIRGIDKLVEKFAATSPKRHFR